MVNQPELSGCSIVLLGKFNPAIFHPVWLEARGIEEPVVDYSDIDLLTHRDLTSFSIDIRSYMVQASRFQIQTHTAPWVSILDITTKIFVEHLYNTPITGFGINRTVHFSLPSVSSRNQLGRMLAPIEPWDDYGESMNTKDVDLTGGLQSLTMKRKFMLDRNSLETNVTIEPSAQIPHDTGVYMHINCHHSLVDLPDGHGSDQAMTLLGERFEPAMEESRAIFETIMKRGVKL